MKKVIIRGTHRINHNHETPANYEVVPYSEIEGEVISFEYVDSDLDPKVGNILVNADFRVRVLARLWHVVVISKSNEFDEFLGLRTIDSLKEEGFKIEG